MAKLKFDVVPIEEVPKDDAFDQDDRALILVVDDERVIADTLAMILGKSGYRVMTAYEGQTALTLACAIQPALLLTDVAMPGMTGIDLAMEVRDLLPTCRILLFSGHAAAMDLLEDSREKGYDFELLSKPVHPSDMLRRISASLSFPRFAESATSSYSLLSQ
jgi:CheY-like chemotaxis protein